MSASPADRGQPVCAVTVIVFTGGSGLTHYAMSLARGLAEHCDVELLVGRSYVGEGFPPLPCRVVPFFGRTRQYPWDLLRLAAHLLRHRHRVALMQSTVKLAFVDGLLFRMLGLLGIRRCMTVHDVLPHSPRPWSRLTHRWLYGSFDRLVVHSERSRAAVQAMGVRTQAHVLPHGVYDIFDFDGETRQQARARHSPFAPEDFVLLFFGHIERRKGIQDFLDLMDRLAGQPGWRFIIAGRNDLARSDAALQARLVAARQDSRCLVMDGGVPFAEVQRCFRIADAVVLPYREGTTSGVLKLALAFGLPVLASDVGDLAEALADGIGVSVPADFDTEDLLQGLQTLRRQWPEHAAAVARASVRYGWPRIASGYAAMAAEVAPRR